MLTESVAGRIKDFARRGKPIVVWGIGNNGRDVVKFLHDEGISIAHIVDKRYELLGVESPGILAGLSGDVSIVVTIGQYDVNVDRRMKRYGLEEGIDYIWAFMEGRNFCWQGSCAYTDRQGNVIYSSRSLLNIFMKVGAVDNTICFADSCQSEGAITINVRGSHNHVYVDAERIGEGMQISVEGDQNRIVIGKGSICSNQINMTVRDGSVLKLGAISRIGEKNIFYATDRSGLFVGRDGCIEGPGNIGVTDRSLFACKRKMLFRGGAYSMDSEWQQLEIWRKCSIW